MYYQVLLFDVRIVDFHNPKDVPVMKLKEGEIEPENCEKVPEGKILNMQYEARLETGHVIDSLEDIKIIYKRGEMIHALLVLLKVTPLQ